MCHSSEIEGLSRHHHCDLPIPCLSLDIRRLTRKLSTDPLCNEAGLNGLLFLALSAPWTQGMDGSDAGLAQGSQTEEPAEQSAPIPLPSLPHQAGSLGAAVPPGSWDTWWATVTLSPGNLDSERRC